jgi:hypothetical protein
VQTLLNRYYHWKKETREPASSPVFFELFDVPGIAAAEETFYRVGVSIDEARLVLDEQLANAMMLARYIAAHVYAMVLEEPAAVWNRSFVSSLQVDTVSFDPARMAADYAPHAACLERYPWPPGWNPEIGFCFRTARRTPAAVFSGSASAVVEET